MDGFQAWLRKTIPVLTQHLPGFTKCLHQQNGFLPPMGHYWTDSTCPPVSKRIRSVPGYQLGPSVKFTQLPIYLMFVTFC